jgi:adenylate cyclase
MEQIICFSAYRFEIDTGRLWSGQRELRLTPKASAVMSVLVKNADRPVPKDEFFATVWNGTVVSDDALTTCIQELRKVLEDDARQPRFIETRHRRGYQFIAEVTKPTTEYALVPNVVAHDTYAIAVLPFSDMSPDGDQDYLCEGIAEELINALTRIEGLRVVSRTASFLFRTPGADIRAVGRDLGVGTLLEGSVRKSNDHLRVTVQLVEVATGYHRWSQRFNRTFDDVFAIQDEIAESVALSLRGSLLNEQEKQALRRPHTGTEAYEYYLRGLQHLPRMTETDLYKSGEMFESAIEKDPSYGPALAGLGIVHATLYEWFGSTEEDLRKAERASRRALEIAPNLAEAHVARGCALSLSRSYDEAATEFETAIRLNANLFDAYYYFARTCFARGDIERSAELFRAAAKTRQEDFQSPLLLSQSLRVLGRNEEAKKALLDGLHRAEHSLMLNPVDGRALSLGASALAADGQAERAAEWSRRSLELYPDDMSTVMNAVCEHAIAGRKEEALALLERAVAKGWGKRDWLERDPDYDTLRDNPRFIHLLAKLK